MNLILGTAQFDPKYGVYPSNFQDLDHLKKIIELAIKLKIKKIDTSPLYGVSNKLLSIYSDNFEIDSKIKDLSNFEQLIDSNLLSLGKKKLDVLYLHNSTFANKNKNFFKEILQYKSHKFNQLGISIYTKKEFLNALKLNLFDVIQFPFNVVDKKIDLYTRKIAKLNGVKLFARSIFLQGILTDRPSGLPPKFKRFENSIKILDKIANSYKMSLTELSFRYVLSQNFLDGVVFGVNDVNQLSELAIFFKKGRIDDHIISEIEDIDFFDNLLIDPRRWNELI